MVGHFKKKPIIAFVWGDLPEAKRRQTFAKAEPIIYLIEGKSTFWFQCLIKIQLKILEYLGLSHLIAASFSEDQYGVVQKDLPDLLSMLLDFQTVF